jgi:hypothetical protein
MVQAVGGMRDRGEEGGREKGADAWQQQERGVWPEVAAVLAAT